MIEFYKMSGSGNDFILIDNRDGSLAVGDVVEFVKSVCQRKISVGADGLFLIEKSDRVDFRWRFYNADGSEAAMCGNGARCAARFAYLSGIAGERMSFETGAGIIDAEVRGDIVKVRLTEPFALVMDDEIRIENTTLFIHSINTGVPHVVHFVRDPDDFDVFNTGRAIRRHEHYQPAGTNANFAAVLDNHTLRVRTYERGVEDETLACGTGSVASALIAARKGLVESPVDVRVQSGETLRIHFERTEEGFTKVYLEGKAKVVYQGVLWDEAWAKKGE
ncbi:MAG: diaminopimelate epimerase [Syntrophales bacterium]